MRDQSEPAQRSEGNGLCSVLFSKYLSLYFAWQRRAVKEDLAMGQQGKHQGITILEEGRILRHGQFLGTYSSAPGTKDCALARDGEAC